jgi:hypothetical protein
MANEEARITTNMKAATLLLCVLLPLAEEKPSFMPCSRAFERSSMIREHLVSTPCVQLDDFAAASMQDATAAVHPAGRGHQHCDASL